MTLLPLPRLLAQRAPLLFFVSAALNLLLIGVVLGRVIWTPPGPSHPPPGNMLRGLVTQMGREMSAEDRAILERAFRAHGGDGSTEDAHRAIGEAIRSAIRAEPFDRAALEQALAAASQYDLAERAAFGQTLLDAATQLSPDGRRHLAGWPAGPGTGPPQH